MKHTNAVTSTRPSKPSQRPIDPLNIGPFENDDRKEKGLLLDRANKKKIKSTTLHLPMTNPAQKATSPIAYTDPYTDVCRISTR